MEESSSPDSGSDEEDLPLRVRRAVSACVTPSPPTWPRSWSLPLLSLLCTLQCLLLLTFLLRSPPIPTPADHNATPATLVGTPAPEGGLGPFQSLPERDRALQSLSTNWATGVLDPTLAPSLHQLRVAPYWVAGGLGVAALQLFGFPSAAGVLSLGGLVLTGRALHDLWSLSAIPALTTPMAMHASTGNGPSAATVTQPPPVALMAPHIH